MNSLYQATETNAKFVEMLSSQDPEMNKQAALNLGTYLKAQIYEDSFFSRIIPPTPVTPEQCDRSPDGIGFTYVIDKEFKSINAVTSTMRGLGDFRYAEGERYAIPFHRITSDEVEMDVDEIRAMRQPITSVVRNRTAFEIRKQMDKEFIGQVNFAIAQDPANQEVSIAESSVTPDVIRQLRNILDGRGSVDGLYLRAATILMTRAQWNSVPTWIQQNIAGAPNTGVGAAGGITDKFWADGYEYDKLFGLRVVVTDKSDVVADNEIYVFSAPEYLGHHLTLNDDRFMIEKRFTRVKWKGVRTMAFNIGNAYACGKVVLTG